MTGDPEVITREGLPTNRQQDTKHVGRTKARAFAIHSRSGVWRVGTFGAEKFNLEADIKAVHVPAGPGDAIADTIALAVAGHTDYQLVSIPLAMVDIRAGRLRPLGVTTKKRSSLLPKVPTIAEAGVSGFD